MSPVRPDAPLRKVTLNLYEADCAFLEAYCGHGWSTWARDALHDAVHIARAGAPTAERHPARTLGDLADDS